MGVISFPRWKLCKRLYNQYQGTRELKKKKKDAYNFYIFGTCSRKDNPVVNEPKQHPLVETWQEKIFRI